jgi:hypothetical protein
VPSPDKGTSGSGSTDDSSGGNSLSPDTTTQLHDNNPTIRSTTPDQSLSGVQPDQGQTTTTPDKGTSGSGSTDDSSGCGSSTSGDSSTNISSQ